MTETPGSTPSPAAPPRATPGAAPTMPPASGLMEMIGWLIGGAAMIAVVAIAFFMFGLKDTPPNGAAADAGPTSQQTVR